MADQSAGPLGLPPSVWVVLVVGLAGVFAANHRPFEDARPADDTAPLYRHTPADNQDVEARQWEDPFSAVAVARRGREGEATHELSRLKAGLQSDPAGRVLIFGAMVTGAPYADDIETRRRTRYAVLAGLSKAGYVPDDNQHIGFAMLPASLIGHATARAFVAYEWLHADTNPGEKASPGVLLLWLDQDVIRNAPMRIFSALVEAIAPGDAAGTRVEQVILGPADSDGLKRMSAELDSNPPADGAPAGANADSCSVLGSSQRNLWIYSSRATAADWWIVSDQVKQRYPDTTDERHGDHFNDRCSHVHLYRTVASDFTVVRSLYRELQYRGVQHVSEIALITERDTLYARLISRYFNGCDGTEPIAENLTVTDGADPSKPLCFTYLRGLDGLAPPAPDPADTVQPTDAKSSAPSPTAPRVQDTATGQSQFDYLRRLTAELASQRDDPSCRWLARRLNLGDQSAAGGRCARRIKAIGVVGSDIYDKLLILQALRRAFPRYIFFTTDLDARLTDQQNLGWTHELVVGSGVGLLLRPELQGTIPPFRDSYQTATYYSTLHAVQRFRDAGKETPAVDLTYTRRPHVFEIGRTAAFDLTRDGNADVSCAGGNNCKSIAAVRPPPLWSTGSTAASLIVAIIVVGIIVVIATTAMGDIWMLQLLRPLFSREATAAHRRRLVMAALTTVVIVLIAVWAWNLLVAALTSDGRRSPAPIFGGASHWAASMIEALSIMVVVTLVIRGQRKLGANAARMLREFSIDNTTTVLIDAYAAWLKEPAPRRRRWRERAWFPLRRLTGGTRDPHPAIAHLSPLERLISQYLYRGRGSARIMRVVCATVASSVLVLALEYVLMIFEFNLGISFVNGFSLVDTHYVERGVEDFISLINLLAIQFLIFWVGDAMLLTRSFVLALQEDKPYWPDPVIDSHSKSLGLSKGWTAMWLDLRLIAWRTGWVSNLIWYPSLMIAAMAATAMTVDFGDFGFASNPVALIVSACFVVSAAVLLRRVAEGWRSDVLFALDDARLSGEAPSNRSEVHVPQLDRLAKRVKCLAEGAFAPYSQQPLVRAVIVPAVTYGATAALQYLHIAD